MKLSIPRLVPLFATLSAAASFARADPPAPPVAPDTWTAVDALGRTLPGYPEAGPVRNGKTVGIFSFLWLGEHGNAGPFDISKIVAQDPDALSHPNSPLWGPVGVPHHWGESEFGYYRADDPYVLRKHAQMLSDAGVDVVIFDNTNNLTYPRSWRALGEAWSEVRKEGGRTPQFAFIGPFGDPANVVQTLYEDLYKPGLYRDLWFRWEGKPLILADPAYIRPDRMRLSHSVPGMLGPGKTAGQSFTALRPFVAAGGSFPTYGTKNSGVTLTVYAGDSPGGRLLARKRFEKLSDNAVAMVDLPAQMPAGTYYLEQSDPRGTVGWWSDTGNVYAGGREWSDGQPEPGGARSLFVRYAESNSDAAPTPLFTAK